MKNDKEIEIYLEQIEKKMKKKEKMKEMQPIA